MDAPVPALAGVEAPSSSVSSQQASAVQPESPVQTGQFVKSPDSGQPRLVPQPRDRRKEKPHLSCIFCRGRKVRCDRKLPCKTCVDRGIAVSCAYKSTDFSGAKISVGDRIQQLETLVQSLLRQQCQAQNSSGLSAPADSAQLHEVPSLATHTANPCSTPPQNSISFRNSDHVSEKEPSSLPLSQCQSPSSLGPLDPGSIRIHSHGATYVGSAHWASVLESIADLRNHYEEEEEARLHASSETFDAECLGPRLLYEPKSVTKSDIINSIPQRSIADRMVAKYFNSRGVVPEVLHSSRFLEEYEQFWLNPNGTPIAWIGLLFSVMCLSTQFQQFQDCATDRNTIGRANLFREQTVRCLNLAQYTTGCDYVLETLVNYLTSEQFLSKDSTNGLWLVQGIIVQIALSLGFHRDPSSFPKLSPFTGEMRRRIWAVIVQMDLRLSSQMALPRLLKLQESDTMEPRNLLDTDFSPEIVELPPSRPETEVTPVLYSLARSRIDRMNGLVSDLINNTQEPPYSKVMSLDSQLQNSMDSLPPTFRWKPLAKSFMEPPQIVMHRVLLQLALQRQIVWLHRKYLSPLYVEADYSYSHQACVAAAIKILDLQRMVDEEIETEGLLHSVRWMFMSSRFQAVFLLGISIICYYIQVAKAHPSVALDSETMTKIYDVLQSTYPTWAQLRTISVEAEHALNYLSQRLDLPRPQRAELQIDEIAYPTTSELPLFDALEATFSLEQMDWDAFDGKL